MQSGAAPQNQSLLNQTQKELLSEIVREFQRFVQQRSGHFLRQDAPGQRRNAYPRLEFSSGKLMVSEAFKASGSSGVCDATRDYYLGQLEKYEQELNRATSLVEVEVLLPSYFTIGGDVIDCSCSGPPHTKLDFSCGLLKCVWTPGEHRGGEVLTDLELDKLNVLLARLRNPPKTGTSPTLFTYSPDYCSVCIRGAKYSLTTDQARVIQFLHEQYERGNPNVSQAYIAESILDTKSLNFRLRDTFKSTPESFQALIKRGMKRGLVRLNLP